MHSWVLWRYHNMSIEFNNTTWLGVAYHGQRVSMLLQLWKNYLTSSQSSGKSYRIFTGIELDLVFQCNKMMKMNTTFLNFSSDTSEDGIYTSFSQWNAIREAEALKKVVLDWKGHHPLNSYFWFETMVNMRKNKAELWKKAFGREESLFSLELSEKGFKTLSCFVLFFSGNLAHVSGPPMNMINPHPKMEMHLTRWLFWSKVMTC